MQEKTKQGSITKSTSAPESVRRSAASLRIIGRTDIRIWYWLTDEKSYLWKGILRGTVKLFFDLFLRRILKVGHTRLTMVYDFWIPVKKRLKSEKNRSSPDSRNGYPVSRMAYPVSREVSTTYLARLNLVVDILLVVLLEKTSSEVIWL